MASNLSAPTEPQVEKTYRMLFLMSAVGFIFLAVGIAFQVGVVGQILSGRPVFLNGAESQGGGQQRNLIAAIFPVFFWGLGGYIFLLARNFLLTTTSRGIRVRTAFRQTWEADWINLKVIGRQYQAVQLSDGVHKVWLRNSLKNSAELLALIHSKLG